MYLIKGIKKVFSLIPMTIRGYSHTCASIWKNSIQSDLEQFRDKYDLNTIRCWHKRGYLCNSIHRYELLRNNNPEYITDLQYLCLEPFNNVFGKKWLEDMLTTNRILHEYGEHFRTVYFSIIQRDGNTLILRVGHEDRCYTAEDVIALLQDKGSLEFLPTYWDSQEKSYTLRYQNSGSNRESFFIEDTAVDKAGISELLQNTPCAYLIADPVEALFDFDGTELEHIIKFWITNDDPCSPTLLNAELYVSRTGESVKTNMTPVPVDLENGSFEYEGKHLHIPGWAALRDELFRVSRTINQISYYTVSVVFKRDGGFTFCGFEWNPSLPELLYDARLNNYLKNRYEQYYKIAPLAERIQHLDNRLMTHLMMKFARRGIRPYMQKLWVNAAWNDLLHTKNVPLRTKIWALKHGFLSYRSYQYGLTKDNYQNYLSDYDYYWLNRINNRYQKWINDKTTFRFLMEPFKEYIPQYYFSCYKRNGQTVISKMSDCPDDISDGFEGLIQILRKKGKLAFKASAGTHGDGFYCLAFEDGLFLANGKPGDVNALRQLVEDVKSFYIVTEYLEMHRDLKKIYAKSVNTVRVMVINEHGYDPKIMQTYMRIGSEKSGYTDNVGYGGICVMVDIATGRLYNPQTIKDHVFYDCPNHPDTGTAIVGFLPNWDLVKEKVLEICRYFCELEYLGFDIAITEKGFQILEINIHQDLHKVASFNEELRDYYQRKVASKRAGVSFANQPH